MIMIPAMLSCPVSWTLEYNGILMAMSEYRTRYAQSHRTETICVDKKLESIPGMERDFRVDSRLPRIW